jgi:hypothetical protein
MLMRPPNLSAAEDYVAGTFAAEEPGEPQTHLEVGVIPPRFVIVEPDR